MLRLMLIFCFISTILAQTPGFGHCPIVNTVSSFDARKYDGEWFEYRRSVPNFFEVETKCVKLNYSNNYNGTLKVVKKRVSSITGQASVLIGLASADTKYCVGFASECSKFIYTFPLPLMGSYHIPYWVLNTDYTSYAVIYGCSEVLGAHTKYLWILTRDLNPAESVIAAAKTAVQNNGLGNIPTVAVNQKDCEWR